MLNGFTAIAHIDKSEGCEWEEIRSRTDFSAYFVEICLSSSPGNSYEANVVMRSTVGDLNSADNEIKRWKLHFLHCLAIIVRSRKNGWHLGCWKPRWTRVRRVYRIHLNPLVTRPVPTRNMRITSIAPYSSPVSTKLHTAANKKALSLYSFNLWID